MSGPESDCVTLKEALAALNRVDDCNGLRGGVSRTLSDSECRVVRSALEAALREAEAWKEIEEWTMAKGKYGTASLSGFCERWEFALVSPEAAGTKIRTRIDATRPEVLFEAAAWCRADRAST